MIVSTPGATYERAQAELAEFVVLWLLSVEPRHRGDRLVQLINGTVVPGLNRRPDLTPRQRDTALMGFSRGVLHRLRTAPVTADGTVGRA